MESADRHARRGLLVAAVAGVACLVVIGVLLSPHLSAGTKSLTATASIEGDGRKDGDAGLPAASPAAHAAVSGAPGELRLGFNNAEQVVGDGASTHVVWVVDDELQIAKRDSHGDVIEATTVVRGAITLPAIAATEEMIVVGWSERSSSETLVKVALSSDRGASFGPAVTIGTGTGISLAASGGRLAAVWHDGEENASARILLSTYDGERWSAPVRVDESDAAPVWAAVDGDDGWLYVTWRDNRSGAYTVWFRRSGDWGQSWLPEQQMTTTNSGDPDVCVTGGILWLAHHGHAQISLLRSADGGATFEQTQVVGSGWFAHLSCLPSIVALGWEATTGPAQAGSKGAGWAAFDAAGAWLGSGEFADGDTAATSVFLVPDSRSLEVLWVQVSASEPLTGTLKHEFVTLP